MSGASRAEGSVVLWDVERAEMWAVALVAPSVYSWAALKVVWMVVSWVEL